MINVAIVEDNNTIRNGLAALINATDGYKCAAAYQNAESFLAELKSKNFDVILMDIGLPGMNGIEAVKKAKFINAEVDILMLTIYEESEIIFEALCAGACGYLVKKTPPARLLEAIKDAHEGGSPMSSNIARKVISTFQAGRSAANDEETAALSSREKEVLFQLAEGNNYQEIADALFISVDTIRHHIRNIYKKLHVHSQSEAVAKAIRKKII
ncbi:MAG TPA: response regulator transcription factor [Ignavibacteriaceae bacterium]|nr:response regulator transcription factor [Ignavibacteriaceae bacterium]